MTPGQNGKKSFALIGLQTVVSDFTKIVAAVYALCLVLKGTAPFSDPRAEEVIVNALVTVHLQHP